MNLLPDPVAAFVSANRWIIAAIGAALIVAALCTLSYCVGGAGETAKQQDGTIKLQTSVIAADTNAADARVTDATRIQNQQQEIQDAEDNASNDDDARRQRGCVILRQQGRDTSRIAACR